MFYMLFYNWIACAYILGNAVVTDVTCFFLDFFAKNVKKNYDFLDFFFDFLD
jgi:hypothetical protein